METAIFDPVKSVAKTKIKSIVTLNTPRFVENSWTIFFFFFFFFFFIYLFIHHDIQT